MNDAITNSSLYIPGEGFYTGNPQDFCGFHFGGFSSKDLGIVRVSNGSRYDENLTPTIENKTVQVPGSHGYYFFGSYYKDKTFSINIAFDSLTEAQIRNLTTLFSPCNTLQELWFDERPYVAYNVKVTSPINLKYICFNEGDNHRLYKGEGTISLQCFNPFGYDRFKYLKEYKDSQPEGIKEDELDDYINEWAEGSRLLNEQGENDNQFKDGVCNVYNAGDMETDFNIVLKLDDIENGNVYLWGASYPWGNADLGTLVLKNIQSEGEYDAYIRINSKLNLIEGLDYTKQTTGTTYNKYMESGDFFKIPVNTDKDNLNDRTKLFLTKTLKGAYALVNLYCVQNDELVEDKDYDLVIIKDAIENADFNFHYKYL